MFWLLVGGGGLLAGAWWLSREMAGNSTRTLAKAAPIVAPPPPPLPVAVGRIDATAQETPWTCGPASLRAVLAHYGRDVSEAELSMATVLAPALGATPEGMVKAAQAYGCQAGVYRMNGLSDLVALLARGVPPIVIVDSWTRPGQVGHYVVVSHLDGPRGLVTLMDPHTEGNWRVITLADFNDRWWAKRRARGGDMVVVKRLAVIVEAGAGMVAVGADKSPVVPPLDPSALVPVMHGRTERLDEHTGWLDQVGSAAKSVYATVFKAAGTALLGPAAPVWNAAVTKMSSDDAMKAAGSFGKFINNASNEDVVIWGLQWLQSCWAKMQLDPKHWRWRHFNRVGITKSMIMGDLTAQVEALFRAMSGDAAIAQWGGGLAWSAARAVLQALAIALYGGLDARKVLDAALASAVGKKMLKSGDDAGWAARRAWIDETLAALRSYRDAHAAPVIEAPKAEVKSESEVKA